MKAKIVVVRYRDGCAAPDEIRRVIGEASLPAGQQGKGSSFVGGGPMPVAILKLHF